MTYSKYRHKSKECWNIESANIPAIKIKYLSVHLSNFTKTFHSISDILEDTE